ncbi:MAG: flagellar hook-basal body complex protein [Desulfurivibrionaceae bacterium]
MGVSSSLYASISGLNTMGNAMSVMGDNVSNVNTIAFKSSLATFQDVLSQSVATAAGTAQVGRGVTLTNINGVFAQGSFQSTSSPTDLAIGGQGFFMLRAVGSAAADMYTRAGQFGFDKDGNLVNPTGNFVQGWTLNSTTGQKQGAIGDINLGKTTPPVQTSSVQVIANLDSRVPNEATYNPLYDAWNGTNVTLPVPTAPINSNAYSYTTALKAYDSVGASHDLTVYFARTTNDNQWQYLVTCNPNEDHRVLSTGRDPVTGALNGTPDVASVYTPDTTYNDLTQKGAGALQYGVLSFSTSGAISNISAYDVPPDGKVDPAQNTNRLTLSNTDSYYSFGVNFTGDKTNQQIALNLGAKYSGQPTAVTQVLVTDGAAYATTGTSTPITKETLWNTVYDNTGTKVDTTTPAVVSFGGYKHDGTYVDPALAANKYTLTAGGKVQDLLDKINSAFGCICTIDATGHINMTDGIGGPSGLSVTTFGFSSGVNPFGATTAATNAFNVTTSKQQVVSTARAVTTAGGTTPIQGNTALSSVFDSTGKAIGATDAIIFTGKRGDNVAINATFTVGTSYGSPLTAPNNPPTMQDLLTWLKTQFHAEASVDGAGRLVLTDEKADDVAATGYHSALALTSITPGVSGAAPFGAGPFTKILADTTTVDGSHAGGLDSIGFTTEALSTTQYANSSTTIFQNQNGFAAGFLQSVSVDTKGAITGNYSNGQVLQKAQVALASFNNLAGLQKEGGNVFRETTASGAPVTGAPGTNGLGSISPNSLEQSNVDLGTEFVNLITTQRGFEANSKVITTTDSMMQTLINIIR